MKRNGRGDRYLSEERLVDVAVKCVEQRFNNPKAGFAPSDLSVLQERLHETDEQGRHRREDRRQLLQHLPHELWDLGHQLLALDA